METQSSLMQLFMSLGTSNAASDGTGEGLLGLGSGQFNSVYDEVLQGLQADPLLQGADQSALQQLTQSLNPNTEKSALSTLQADVTLAGTEEEGHQGLPVGGQGLPLLDNALTSPLVDSGQKLSGVNPLARAMARTTFGQSEDELNDVSAKGSQDNLWQSDQGAIEYRQQMVSSILHNSALTPVVPPTSLPTPPPAMSTSLQGGRAELRSIVPQAARQGDTDELQDSLVDLDVAQQDRFLGAEGPNKPSVSQTLAKPVVDVAQSSVTPASLAPQLTSAEAQVSVQEPESLLDDDLQLNAELDQQRELKADVEKSLQLNKGQQAWGDAISERITMAAAKDVQQATIHLDPPELGAMELKLEINEERQTQVQVQVQSPQVKEALESSATRLREMLEKEGLQLANLDVSDQGQQQQQW